MQYTPKRDAILCGVIGFVSSCLQPINVQLFPIQTTSHGNDHKRTYREPRCSANADNGYKQGLGSTETYSLFDVTAGTDTGYAM